MFVELNNENFNFTEYREIKINEIGTSSYTMRHLPILGQSDYPSYLLH
jgi:hypothetical protein